MATRFDRVTRTPPRTAERPATRPSVGLSAGLQAPVASVPRVQAPSGSAQGLSGAPGVERDGARILPVRPLAAAVGTWLALILAVCYVLGPLGAAATGLAPSDRLAFVAVPAFVATSFVTLIGVLAGRPSVRLQGATRADAVAAAMIGSLGVWALVQNTLLVPFAWMSAGEIAARALLNGVEAALLAVMFATLTARPASALALGAGFKLILLGLALTLLRWAAPPVTVFL